MAAGCRATAWHVDHGLRPESADEARVVEAIAARLGAGFMAVTVVVAPGPNLEARARSARYGAMPADALTGHTADDQAETILLNLVRGAGLDGLAGIRRGATKPILDLRRAETRSLCGALGIEPIEDPSNADPAFRRNRVRHELLPLLDDIAERDVAAVLAGQAARLRDEADALDAIARELDPTDARAVGAAGAAVARRAVRLWLTRELALDHPPPSDAIERVLGVARAEATACQGPGWEVRRSGMRLSARRA